MTFMTRKWHREVRTALIAYGCFMLVYNIVSIAVVFQGFGNGHPAHVEFVRTWYGHGMTSATLFVTAFLTLATLWAIVRKLWANYGPGRT